MTKDQFAQKYLDEMVGLLLIAFSAEENSRGITETQVAMKGKFMMDTMKRAKLLLARMHDDLAKPEPPKAGTK